MGEFAGRVDYGDDQGFVPTAFGGHCLYVRRCVEGEADDGCDTDVRLSGCRMVNGVLLHGVTADNSCSVEVIGWGPRLDEKCTIKHARKWRRAEIERFTESGSTEARACKMATGRYVTTEDIEIGTLMLLPLPWPCVDERVMRSPLVDSEAFIESSLPIYTWEQE